MDEATLTAMASRLAGGHDPPPRPDPLSELASLISDCRVAQDAVFCAYRRGEVQDTAVQRLTERLSSAARSASEALRGSRDEMMRTVAGTGRAPGAEKEKK